jgi:hypothetical protein
LTQTQREMTLTLFVIALFAFGAAWFAVTMLRWLYSDAEMRAMHPRIRRYLGLFGAPGVFISVGCFALATAFGLDPFNFQDQPNPLITVYFGVIDVIGVCSLCCLFVYAGWHYVDSIAGLRRKLDNKEWVAFRNREILLFGFVLSAIIGSIVMLAAGAYYGNALLALALAATAVGGTLVATTVLIVALRRP